MQNKGLLFIPDISGFTRFVNETEIDHSRLIIQELLELLINANTSDMEVSEVEGDAILFYRFGPPPDPAGLYRQVEAMFRDFHRHLLAYDHRRYCQCRACMSAVGLTLKIITHYGEFTGYNVKQFNKLIGKDVIVAHQLLKNDIPDHEYWLITPELLRNSSPEGLTDWMQWHRSVKATDAGEIAFHYTHLGPLRKNIAPEPPSYPVFTNRRVALSFSREYETDIITLFHASGDFNYRSRWHAGVKQVEELNHFLPRVGMRCRCMLEDGQEVIYASSYAYRSDRIEFTETEERKRNVTRFVLEKLGNKKTKLTIEYCLKPGLVRRLRFAIADRTRLTAMYEQSLRNLEGVIQEIKLPPLDLPDTGGV